MKKTAFIIILSCLSFLGFAQYSILDSLILYYPFDGNANDWSGYHFDGTVSGASLTTDHQGNANHAYYFDGVNDYVDLPNHISLHPNYPFTIGAWINTEDASTGNFNFINTEFHTNDIYSGAWLNIPQTHKFAASVGNNSGVGSADRRSKLTNQSLADQTWYYVLAVYNNFSDVELYVNCTKDIGFFNGGGSIYYRDFSLHGSIGRQDSGLMHYAKGTIDEVAIWNRALDPDEILQLCETDIWQIMQMKAETKESQGFSIFPNPMTTKTEIYFPNPNKEMHTIKIYSISGQEIANWENINTEVFSIERGNLANGMYIVELYNTLTNKSIFEKLIIQ